MSKNELDGLIAKHNQTKVSTKKSEDFGQMLIRIPSFDVEIKTADEVWGRIISKIPDDTYFK